VCRHERRRRAASGDAAASACDESGCRCTISEHHRVALVLTAGLAAGAAAAVVSQPFDLLLTRLCGNAPSVTLTSLTDCVIAEGLADQLKYLVSLGPAAFTGLAPRLAMVSVMTAAQFVVYDTLRGALRCPAPAST